MGQRRQVPVLRCGVSGSSEHAPSLPQVPLTGCVLVIGYIPRVSRSGCRGKRDPPPPPALHASFGPC